MNTEKLDSQKIEQNGWKQGACIEVNNSTSINTSIQDNEISLNNGIYIVLSQGCDILNNDLNKEPFVELVFVNKIDACNPEFISGMNPRQLHLELNDDFCIEVVPYKRFFISRHYLQDVKANNTSVSKNNLTILINWITKRYTRHGFPDAFNNRILSRKIQRIKKILSNECIKSNGLYIQLSTDEELPDSEPYSLLVKMLVDKDTFEDKILLETIQNGFDKVLSLLDDISNLNIIAGSQVQSTDDITLYEYLNLKKWDFDYISFLNNEQNSIIQDVIH